MTTALDPGALTTRALASSLPQDGLQTFRRHWIIAIGLEAHAMASAALAYTESQRLRVVGGLVVSAHRISAAEGILDVTTGDHPIARDRSTLAAEQLAQLCRLVGHDDVVLVLLSNGASALVGNATGGVGQWDDGRLATALRPAAVQPVVFDSGEGDIGFSPLFPAPADHRIRPTVIASAL